MNKKKYIALICGLFLCLNLVQSKEVDRCMVAKCLISNISSFSEFDKDDLIVFNIYNNEVNCNSEINNPNVKFYKNKELFTYVVEKYFRIEDIKVKNKKCYVDLVIRNGNILNFYLLTFTIRNNQLSNMQVKFIKNEPLGGGSPSSRTKKN
jgi:hypothetical protein